MKKLKSIVFPALFLALILTVLVSCGKEDTNNEKVSIRGQIMQLSKGETGDANILVEGKIEEDTAFDKASILVPKEVLATVDELKEGMKVEVYFTGEVRESYPVQATALKIKIIK